MAITAGRARFIHHPGHYAIGAPSSKKQSTGAA
jgi:hypothetical protein